MATELTGRTQSASTDPPPWTAESLPLETWEDLSPAAEACGEDVDHREGYWATTDNHQLYWQSWSADSADVAHRGSVGLVHGYGEHSGRYHHVATALVRAGYNVMALDLRGHGRSTGRRGFVRDFARYVDDLAMLKRRAIDRWPDRPLFLLGHSNGGLVTLSYALRKPDGVDGFAVTSPLCRLAMRVSPVKKLGAKLTSRLVPTLSLPSEIDPAELSHLDRVVEDYRDDPLVFETANTRWFTEVREANAELQRRAEALDQPFLFLVAGGDRIVDPGATESLFHSLGSLDRQLEVFPELYHEVLNESSWRPILRRLVVWMERHRSPDSTNQARS